jgi:hypothetical protein
MTVPVVAQHSKRCRPGKLHHPTAEAAMVAADQTERGCRLRGDVRTGRRIVIYFCNRCSVWHVGTELAITKETQGS